MPPPGGLRTAFHVRLGASPAGSAWTAGFQPTGGMFSPGLPLAPADPQPVRALDFDVGANTVFSPRAGTPFSFGELRGFANVEPVRLAIETSKDQIERLDWRIRRRCDTHASAADPDVARLTRFFARPDGATPFATWLRALLEDLLVLDAPVAEKRRDRSGRLIGLDVTPGDTIKLLVDDTGRRPRPPLPAFQQVIKGTVWTDLTTDDLLYAPRNVRPNRLYGLSPVEQIVVTLNTVLRRQTVQLGYFTEGNVPSGILNAPSSWGPDAIRTLQEACDVRFAGASTVQVESGTNPVALFQPWYGRSGILTWSLEDTASVGRYPGSASAGYLGLSSYAGQGRMALVAGSINSSAPTPVDAGIKANGYAGASYTGGVVSQA